MADPGPIDTGPVDTRPVDTDVVAALERALAEARAQYAALRRTLDEVIAHRDGISAGHR